MKAEGYFVKRSPSYQLWFTTRGLSQDPTEAEATLGKHRLYSGDQRRNAPVTKFVPVGGKTWASNQPPTLDYWRYLSEVLQAEPTEARDRFFLAMLQPLGIEKGKPFKPDDRQTKILTDAAQVGDIMARS